LIRRSVVSTCFCAVFGNFAFRPSQYGRQKTKAGLDRLRLCHYHFFESTEDRWLPKEKLEIELPSYLPPSR
jgi:hypothetical protein